MTRDLLHAYHPGLPTADPRRYDMPPEWFRLTLTGTRGLNRRVSLQDPLSGRLAGSRIVRRTGNTLVVDVALTDYPRLLTLDQRSTR